MKILRGKPQGMCSLANSFLLFPVLINGRIKNGDSDSIASIAGGISGAFLGIEAIPENWVKNVEKASHLEDLAVRLSAKKKAYRKK